MKRMNFHKVFLSITILALMSLLSTARAQQQRKTTESIYYPKPMESMALAKEAISRILNDKCVSIEDTIVSRDKIKYKKAVVSDEGIELDMKSGEKMIYFSKLFGDKEIFLKMKYYLYYEEKTGEKDVDSYSDKIVGTNNIYFLNSKAGFGITMPDPSRYPVCNKQLADALFTIQKKLSAQRYSSELDAFKQIAKNYCALKTKPSLSEEERKFIVQANFLNQQKDYEKAIELYKKVIGIDQTAYPAAYYNLALLFAQVSNIDAAIFYMQEYLLLEPEAQDARAAQDKIYEWETTKAN
ncbi:MAG: tetratricopeptide repeat protein [Bacteroidales bacterium]